MVPALKLNVENLRTVNKEKGISMKTRGLTYCLLQHCRLRRTSKAQSGLTVNIEVKE